MHGYDMIQIRRLCKNAPAMYTCGPEAWGNQVGEVSGVDSTVFDDLARSVSERLTRRRLARLAGAGVVAAAVAPALGEAKTRRNKRAEAEHNIRGKKAIMCFEGETIRVPRDQRKWLRKGATRGKCGGSCTPTCPPGSCGDDGCGGTCPGCAVGSVCAEGVCQACLVSCDVKTETPKMRQHAARGT